MFALAGRVQNTGLVEVPMGITLREIVFDVGIAAEESFFNAERRQQLSGDARVFARHYVALRQNVQCAQGDVAPVADRRGDQIEAGFGAEWGGLQGHATPWQGVGAR